MKDDFSLWELVGYGLLALIVLLVNLAFLGAMVWVVVKVLRWMGAL